MKQKSKELEELKAREAELLVELKQIRKRIKEIECESFDETLKKIRKEMTGH